MAAQYLSACLWHYSYYQLEDTSSGAINVFLSEIVAKALQELEASYCIEIEEVCPLMCCVEITILLHMHAHTAQLYVCTQKHRPTQRHMHATCITHT